METENEPQETSEEPSEVVQQEATEEVIQEDQQTEYICSVCGELVVPQRIETATGPRYRCPECKKFMKRLTKEEAAEEKEKASGPLVPTEVELTERAKVLMAKYLPTVYGIPAKERSKRIQAVIDTMTPAVATNPLMLHNHVKNFAPNADDRHLEAVITKVFGVLEAEGYRPSSMAAYRPQYPFAQGGQPRQFGQYQYGGRQQVGNQYPPSYEPPWWPPRTIEQPKNMTIIVEGQPVKTDMQGYTAWKRHKESEKKAKQEDKKHELEMEKLKLELKNLAEEGGKSKDETLVEVPFREATIKVPASIAPLYLDKGENKETKALSQKVADLSQKLEDKKEEEHKKEIADLHGGIAGLRKEIENKPTFLEQMEAMDEYAAKRGFSKSGKTTIDVLSDIGTNIDNRAQQILNRMTPGQGEFKPDVKRTPEERQKKARELDRKLNKKDDVLKAEDSLMRTAAKMG